MSKYKKEKKKETNTQKETASSTIKFIYCSWTNIYERNFHDFQYNFGIFLASNLQSRWYITQFGFDVYIMDILWIVRQLSIVYA